MEFIENFKKFLNSNRSIITKRCLTRSVLHRNAVNVSVISFEQIDRSCRSMTLDQRFLIGAPSYLE